MAKAKADTKASKTKADKPAAKKEVAVKAEKVVKTPEQLETETLAAAESSLSKKHKGKIVKGSARRSDDPRYGLKIMVDINTRGADGSFDGNTRTVATSDVHQVHHTIEVAGVLRKERATAKRAEARAKREAAKPAVTEDALDAAGL
jgi:hypothetical protein